MINSVPDTQHPTSRLPVIVITGPTASGKSGLALELAEKWGGEIICADSRTVYKGMDIGTAKPTQEERKRVPHWGLDVVNPGERFTAADFKKLAFAAIADIHERGKIPFLVGGSGLYVDAVVLNFVFGPEVDVKYRKKLEESSVDDLISLHEKQQIPLPENTKNKRYLIRSIEKNNIFNSSSALPDEAFSVFAIQVEKEALRQRIRQRIEHMFMNNIVLETQQLLQAYDVASEAMTANIYKIVSNYLAGEISEHEAKSQCVTRDWRLAKRQITWLRRHDYVRWRECRQARIEIETLLSKYRDG